MPYITETQKNLLANGYRKPAHVGELNYAITKMCLEFHDRFDYHALNDIVGVLECVKQEFYRRMAAPYEDEKMKANGDVFESYL